MQGIERVHSVDTSTLFRGLHKGNCHSGLLLVMFFSLFYCEIIAEVLLLGKSLPVVLDLK